MKKVALFACVLCSISVLQASDEGVTLVEKETPIVLDTVEHAPVVRKDTQEDQYRAQFIKTLFLILGIFFLFFFLFWLIRRFTSHTRPLVLKNSRKHMKVVERRPISPHTCLYYVQVGNKHFILAESKLEVRNVGTLDWEKSGASPPSGQEMIETRLEPPKSS